jgi:hypothetical protein
LKTSRFSAYMETAIVVLLSAYVILRLYNMIFGTLILPFVFTILYFICLFLNKDDNKKVKLKDLLTFLPVLTLSIAASIKNFM